MKLHARLNSESRSLDPLVRRFDSVQHYMEARGFTVGRGTYDGGAQRLATVDIDRADRQEINGAWAPYERSDKRQAVRAIIAAAREALKRFAPGD